MNNKPFLIIDVVGPGGAIFSDLELIRRVLTDAGYEVEFLPFHNWPFQPVDYAGKQMVDEICNQPTESLKQKLNSECFRRVSVRGHHMPWGA